MDMLLLAAFFFLSVLSIGIPLFLSPLLLTGSISLAPLYDLFLIAASSLMILFTVGLVVTNVLRSQFKHHRGFAGVVLGGVVALVMLGLFAASLIQHRDLSNMWGWAQVDLLLQVVGPVNLIWPISYIVYGLASYASLHRTDAPTFYTFVLFAHFVVAALAVMAALSYCVDLIEATKPSELAMLVAQRTETEAIVRPILYVANGLWLWGGFSYNSFRMLVSVFTVGAMGFGYVLTGPAKHLRPASPFMLLLLVYTTAYSFLQLLPLGAILVTRRMCWVVFGRPLIATINESGYLYMIRHPLSFWAMVKLNERVQQASSYEQWKQVQKELETRHSDAGVKRHRWRETLPSSHYEFDRVVSARETLTKVMSDAEASGDPYKLAELLQMLVNRGYANINDPHLYPGLGTKQNIEAFYNEVQSACEAVCETDWGDKFDEADKSDFIQSALHTHGRSALTLSGGGAVAMIHFGLISELIPRGLLPDVISGSSGGSIVAGFLACNTNEEMMERMQPGKLEAIQDSLTDHDGNVVPWFDAFPVMVKRFLQEGVLVDREQFLAVLAPTGMGDLTFKEAYLRTGRNLSITVSTKELGSTNLLNHVNSPNVLVRSAVQVSCSLNGVMRPGPLLSKERDGSIGELMAGGVLYRDGSFQSDLPMQELKAQFHANHFIVSQVEPFVTPFMTDETKPTSSLQHLQRLLLTDLRSRLRKMVAYNVLPAEVQTMACQEHMGSSQDVNIFPVPDIHDLTWRPLSHPTKASMLHWIKSGKQMTWPHIHRIEKQQQLERCLERCADTVMPKVHERRGDPLRKVSRMVHLPRGGLGLGFSHYALREKHRGGKVETLKAGETKAHPSPVPSKPSSRVASLRSHRKKAAVGS